MQLCRRPGKDNAFKMLKDLSQHNSQEYCFEEPGPTRKYTVLFNNAVICIIQSNAITI